MTDPDLRDSNLDRAYRETPRDEPPPELDERIRAAARRAVGTRPQSLEQQTADQRRRSWTSRWRLPLSVAATVVIAATLTVMVQEEDRRPRDDAGRGAVRMDTAPREAEQPAAPATVSPDAVRNRLDAAPAAPPAQSSAPARPAPKTAAEAAPPPPAPAAERKLEKRTLEAEQPAAADSVSGSSQRQEMREQTPAPVASPPLAAPTPAPAPPPAAAPAQAPAPPPAPKAAPQTAPAGAASGSLRRDRVLGDRPERAAREGLSSTVRSPEAWVEDIRSLRAQGREAEAAAELADLRRAYPDFKLPTDLGGPGQ